MDFSRLDSYSRYFILAAILIALLTYWRFRGINVSSVYSYVAQQEVIQLTPVPGMLTNRSLVWNFFGLVEQVINPRSILGLKLLSTAIVLIDLIALSILANLVFGQKFWGFILVFLVALSPYAVVAATSGGPAAIAVTFALLFLIALYKREYVVAGMLSALGFAANLPGLIMFLIVVLEILQDHNLRKSMVGTLFSSSAAFFVTGILIYVYSLYEGYPGAFFLPLGETDVSWTLEGIVPLLVVNLINVWGLIYLFIEKSYHLYNRHFHTLMLWIASVAFCIAQPTTLNLFFAISVSTVLSVIFLHEFAARWRIKRLSVDTVLFLFATVFLFTDLLANNYFVRDVVLEESVRAQKVLNEVVETLIPKAHGAQVVSNFAPSELAVKLDNPVVEVGGGLLGISDFRINDSPALYVVERTAPVDSLPRGSKTLLNISYLAGGDRHTVEVIERGIHK